VLGFAALNPTYGAKGGTYFFTVVTHNRRKFLCVSDNVFLLREAFRYVLAELLTIAV
jgi:REP element-mobilizing transposase RayT